MDFVFQHFFYKKNITFSFYLLLIIMLPFAATAQTPWVLQRAIGLPQSADPQLSFSAVNGNVCWGCNNNNSQFIRTTDGGTTWKVDTIEGAAGSNFAGIWALDSSTAWIAARHLGGGGIYKTTNGGLTWRKDSVAFKNHGYPAIIYFFDSNNGVCVGNPNVGYWEIYTTSDAGTNWVRVDSANIPSPLPGGEAAIYGQVISAGNSVWFNTYQESLYKSNDRGLTWSVHHSLGLGTFAFKDSLNGVFCAFLSGIATTSDGGHTWQYVDVRFKYPSLYGVTYVRGTDNTYIINSDYNKTYPNEPTNPGTAYSTDGGQTWETINVLPNLQGDFAPDGVGWTGGVNDSIYKWIGFSTEKIVADQSYIDRMFARKDKDSVLFRTRFSNPINSQFTANLIYTNLGNTITDSLTLYDDGMHGDSLANDGLYGVYIPPIHIEDYFLLNVSTKEDLTNKYVNTPISQYRFTTAGPVKIDSLSVTNVSSDIYKVKPFFRNEGSSYTVQNLTVKISSNDNSITQIVADSINIASIAPGTTAGPTNDINITVNSSFSGIFNLNFEIMSDGWTYWRDSISQIVTGVDNNITLPVNYNLSQNYPNPFNPGTTIDFVIPKSSFVNLSVYDILGKKVSTLVNEEKAAGSYKVEFSAKGGSASGGNAVNLPSGVYFYKIQAGSFIQVKKMILMK